MNYKKILYNWIVHKKLNISIESFPPEKPIASLSFSFNIPYLRIAANIFLYTHYTHIPNFHYKLLHSGGEKNSTQRKQLPGISRALHPSRHSVEVQPYSRYALKRSLYPIPVLLEPVAVTVHS